MSDRPSKDLLKRLCLAAGPPGAEGAVREVVRRELGDLGRLTHDRLGSLICELPGREEGPRVHLDSHLDEVGFMVQSVTADGYLRFVPLGGWWGHVLLGQRVVVMSDSGGVPGVIAAKPPHFLEAEERDRVVAIKAMLIDLGASSATEVQSLGVAVGDPIAPVSPWVEMAVDGVLSCKAFDNRAGVGVMCETLLALSSRKPPCVVSGCASVQEEVGLRGAGTAASRTRPDVAIVLECSPADDLPGTPEPQGALGSGPQLRFFDPTAIANRKLVRLAIDAARQCGIEVQPAVRRSGGTDAGALHRHDGGVPTLVVAVPARYIHTHASVMHWSDYAAACRLVTELVLRLDQEQVEALTHFQDEEPR